jgi:hypothetical protein
VSLSTTISRCPGEGSEADGWREGCSECLRRTDPHPTATSDNTAAIIANTRANYGQPRAVVEKMISDKILPPQGLQTKGKGNPGYTANQKSYLEGEGIAFEEKQSKQPETPLLGTLPELGSLPQIAPELELPAVGTPEQGSAAPIPTEAAEHSDGEGKRKRKRSRGRKKKGAEGHMNDSQQGMQPPTQPAPEQAMGPAPEPSSMLNIHHSVPKPEPTSNDPTVLHIR